MKVGVVRETAPGERRVALVPETAGKLAAAGFEIVVEPDAGAAASFPDAAYSEAGATLGSPWDADVVVKVRKPAESEIAQLRNGQLLVAFLDPLADPDGIARLDARGVVAFAMESIPRITRAQAMDALSSQATVGGYKSALLAAEHLPRFFPMLMTAAGTVPPAKVLVIGAGVAGLQALATARRLGAVVTGFDVRPVVREQIESLGANWLDLGVTGAEAEGGYARELTPEEMQAQQQALEARISEFDVVITTAAVPGRAAPQDHSGVGRQGDAARLRDRRPRRRDGRQLRADGARRSRRARGRDAGRAHEPAEHDAVPRVDALLPQRAGPAASSCTRRAAQPRLGRRDHLRDLRDEKEGGGARMSHGTLLVFEVTILVLAIFLGFEVISKVPTLLHTPLMSGTNAIHGIVVVGAMLVLGLGHKGPFTWVIGFLAVVLGSANVVGGFVVTDRMLEMFKKREPAKQVDASQNGKGA